MAPGSFELQKMEKHPRLLERAQEPMKQQSKTAGRDVVLHVVFCPVCSVASSWKKVKDKSGFIKPMLDHRASWKYHSHIKPVVDFSGVCQSSQICGQGRRRRLEGKASFIVGKVLILRAWRSILGFVKAYSGDPSMF